MNLPDFSLMNTMQVSYSGEKPWEVSHHFQEGATEEAIQKAEDEIGMPIPNILKLFWQKSDGALLYKNVSGSLWGWKIIGAEKYLENQHRWRRIYFDHWQVIYLLIAELMNPKMPIVWNGKQVLALDSEVGTLREIVIAENVEDFFNRLHESKGSLWWQW